jgi:hypothetical protein
MQITYQPSGFQTIRARRTIPDKLLAEPFQLFGLDGNLYLMKLNGINQLNPGVLSDFLIKYFTNFSHDAFKRLFVPGADHVIPYPDVPIFLSDFEDVFFAVFPGDLELAYVSFRSIHGD